MDSRLVPALRKAFDLHDIEATDDEILEATEGTLIRWRVEVGIACTDLRIAVVEQTKQDWARIRQFFG